MLICQNIFSNDVTVLQLMIYIYIQVLLFTEEIIALKLTSEHANLRLQIQGDILKIKLIYNYSLSNPSRYAQRTRLFFRYKWCLSVSIKNHCVRETSLQNCK